MENRRRENNFLNNIFAWNDKKLLWKVGLEEEEKRWYQQFYMRTFPTNFFPSHSWLFSLFTMKKKPGKLTELSVGLGYMRAIARGCGMSQVFVLSLIKTHIFLCRKHRSISCQNICHPHAVFELFKRFFFVFFHLRFCVYRKVFDFLGSEFKASK